MATRRIHGGYARCLLGLVAASAAGSAWAGAPVRGDFDGDGFADLAIGVPLEDISGEPNAGVVHVLYGSAGGPASGGNQLWHQNKAGIADSCEDKDKFGAALAVCDFNGDGFSDLVIGVPGERVSTDQRTGAIHILFGSAAGLTADDSLFMGVGSLASEVPGRESLRGGAALATGDFDNDGFDDVAVGVPGMPIEGRQNAGRVQIFRGSLGGDITPLSQLFDQNSKGVLDAAAADEEFGKALASGDFDGDGFFDLAIGVPGEKVSGAKRAGAVNVLYGRTSGLHRRGNQFWTQDSIGLAGGSERNDFFGSALVSGDFDGDGFADLAIGAPLEDAGTPEIMDAGSVTVLYGSAAKLTVAGSQEWHQDSNGISNGPDEGDQFGFALAAGDFDGDDNDDLAIGAPLERLSGVIAGAVHVLYGTGAGLRASGDQFWHQDVAGMLNAPDDGDEFGLALGALDFDGDGFLDLAVGVPGEKVSSRAGAGAVAVIFGGGGGLAAAGNQLWTQDSPGIADAPGTDDGFGRSVGD